MLHYLPVLQRRQRRQRRPLLTVLAAIAGASYGSCEVTIPVSIYDSAKPPPVRVYALAASEGPVRPLVPAAERSRVLGIGLLSSTVNPRKLEH